MKTKGIISICVYLTLALLLSFAPAAQAISIGISGFNADEIYENAGGSSVTQPVDTGGGYWGETGYSGIVLGLPAGGQFISATGSGVTYQLQSYAGNNALRMDGTSSFPSPGNLDVIDGHYAKLYILAASGNYASSPSSNITLNFTDSSSVTILNALNAPDWYNPSGNPTAAITGVTRVASPPTSPFAMYETVLDVSAYQALTLASIDFNRVGDSRTVTNVYAVDGTLVPLPPSVLLLGTGILGLVGLGWRRARKEG
jgi:hypothetical protein